MLPEDLEQGRFFWNRLEYDKDSLKSRGAKGFLPVWFPAAGRLGRIMCSSSSPVIPRSHILILP